MRGTRRNEPCGPLSAAKEIEQRTRCARKDVQSSYLKLLSLIAYGIDILTPIEFSALQCYNMPSVTASVFR